MPSVLRISGRTFERQGQVIQPRALVSFCEDCGSEARFGITNKDGKLQTYAQSPFGPKSDKQAATAAVMKVK